MASRHDKIIPAARRAHDRTLRACTNAMAAMQPAKAAHYAQLLVRAAYRLQRAEQAYEWDKWCERQRSRFRKSLSRAIKRQGKKMKKAREWDVEDATHALSYARKGGFPTLDHYDNEGVEAF